MAANHKRFSHSMNNLRFCSKLTSMKQGKSNSMSIGYSDPARKSSFPLVHDQKSTHAGRSVNLPPVEQRRRYSQPKHCSSVDLLQLANNCAKTNGLSKSNRFKRRVSFSDEQSSKPSTKHIPHHGFQTSVASAPEIGLMRSFGGCTSSKPPANRIHPEISREAQNDFARSWPLAPPPGALGSQRLPDVHGKTGYSQNRKRSQLVDELAGDLAKFNKGRSFRLRRINTEIGKKSAHHLAAENQAKKELAVTDTAGFEGKESQIVIETLTDLKLTDGPHEEIVRTEMLSTRNRESSSSDLTSVTAESVRVHADYQELPEYDEEEEERKELDRKCMKWLEDVARERSQNPEKVFLPHLLMS